jgi:hypothetical protein
MRLLLIFGILVGAFALFPSCVKDEAQAPNPLGPICDTLAVSYSQDIRPILDVSCVGSSCHSDVGAPISGGITLEEYEDAKLQADNGKLVCAVKGAGCEIMPPAGVVPLTQEEISKIECWVFDGAPNN